MELDGKRVVILGGSGVLGSLIAAELDRRRARVLLAGRDAERLRAKASAIGAHVPSVLFDLAVPSHAKHVVDTAIDRLGGIDGIVNAAGVVAFGPFDSVSDSVMDELVATDFVGPLRVLRTALPYLDGGFVVNITGVVAEQPLPGMAMYSAVKAALSAATLALGRELRRQNILAVDVRPPHTETGLATRPIAGAAPHMPEGLSPASVATAIVEAIESGQKELAAGSFRSQ